jgi:hypothetical protein
MNDTYIDMPGLGDRSLLFLHIPKTAGTSFRDLLGRRFSPSETLSVGLENKNGVSESLLNADRYRFIHGHFPYEVVNLFSKRPFVFMMLREPVDRAISAFYYMKQEGSSMEQRAAVGQISKERATDYAKARELSLSEFVHHEPRAAARHLGNLQVEFLTCPDLDKRHRYDERYEIDVSAGELDLATKRLATVDVVGLMERPTESKEYLAFALQTRPFGELARSNETRLRPQVKDVDQRTIEALRELTLYDRKLYAVAEEIFEVSRLKMLQQPSALHAEPTNGTAADPRPMPSSFTSGSPLPGEGWYAPENDGQRWFNWTGPASESWIDLGSPAGTDFALHILVVNALRLSSIFEVELLVNGVQVTSDVCANSIGHTISANVPAHLLESPGRANRIVVRVPHRSRPCDSDPMNHDSRILGVAVHSIELVAVT